MEWASEGFCGQVSLLFAICCCGGVVEADTCRCVEMAHHPMIVGSGGWDKEICDESLLILLTGELGLLKGM